MWEDIEVWLIPVLWLALGVFAFVPPAHSAETSTVSLSTWLETTVVTDLGLDVERHPRYEGQRFSLQSIGPNALEDALGEDLRARFSAVIVPPAEFTAGIATSVLSTTVIATEKRISIATVQCVEPSPAAYRVTLEARADGRRDGNVNIRILDAFDGREYQQFTWQGRLSDAERASLQQPGRVGLPLGSVTAPWPDRDMHAAAVALSHQMICQLRPLLGDHWRLGWPVVAGLHPDLKAAIRAAHETLAAFTEIEFDTAPVDMLITMRVLQTEPGLWQLHLAAEPAAGSSLPAFALANYVSVTEDKLVSNFGLQELELPVGAADDFFELELLDTTQQTTGASHADILLKLRIRNRAQWPIAYSLAVSGGYYEHCMPNSEQYRHDQFGELQGVAAAGKSYIQWLTIEKLPHKPAPLYGIPRCAAVRDLASLENFQQLGYRITDYVRWSL